MSCPPSRLRNGPWRKQNPHVRQSQVNVAVLPRAHDRETRGEERANLLALTQALVSIRYDDPELLEIFGGRQAMIESPLIQEIVKDADGESKREDILEGLEVRFA